MVNREQRGNANGESVRRYGGTPHVHSNEQRAWPPVRSNVKNEISQK